MGKRNRYASSVSVPQDMHAPLGEVSRLRPARIKLVTERSRSAPGLRLQFAAPMLMLRRKHISVGYDVEICKRGRLK